MSNLFCSTLIFYNYGMHNYFQYMIAKFTGEEKLNDALAAQILQKSYENGPHCFAQMNQKMFINTYYYT